MGCAFDAQWKEGMVSGQVHALETLLTASLDLESGSQHLFPNLNPVTWYPISSI